MVLSPDSALATQRRTRSKQCPSAWTQGSVQRPGAGSSEARGRAAGDGGWRSWRAMVCVRNRAVRIESGGRGRAGRGSDGTIRLSAEAVRLPGQFRQPASVSLSLSSHAVSEATDPPGRAGHRIGIRSAQRVSRTQVAGRRCGVLPVPALRLRAFPSDVRPSTGD